MQSNSAIGLDIAKSVFQARDVDAADQVAVGRQLKRRFVPSFFEKLPPCLVGPARFGRGCRARSRAQSRHGYMFSITQYQNGAFERKRGICNRSNKLSFQ
jgi:hypothetical protein